jgi:hypothetical protein
VRRSKNHRIEAPQVVSCVTGTFRLDRKAFNKTDAVSRSFSDGDEVQCRYPRFTAGEQHTRCGHYYQAGCCLNASNALRQQRSKSRTGTGPDGQGHSTPRGLPIQRTLSHRCLDWSRCRTCFIVCYRTERIEFKGVAMGQYGFFLRKHTAVRPGALAA